MSLTSKLTFAGSLLSSVSVIAYIYYKQSDDRDKLHAGIIRDVERQEQKKLENMFLMENRYILEQQQELTKKLRAREQRDLEAQGN